MRKDSPTAEEIRAARESVQARLAFGITAAQDWCAETLHTSRRAFQQWESGDRRMHPAFFDLLTIRISEG